MALSTISNIWKSSSPLQSAWSSFWIFYNLALSSESVWQSDMPANICICWKTENTFLDKKKQQNVRQKQNHPNCCCLFLVPRQVQLKSCTAGTWTKTQASTHLPIWLSGPSPSPSSSPTRSTLLSSPSSALWISLQLGTVWIFIWPESDHWSCH